MSTLKNILPIILLLALIGTIAYAVSTQLTIQNDGTIVGFYAYDTAIEGTPIDTIEWGNIAPDSTNTKAIYIESTLTETVTLTIEFVNLDPIFTVTYLPEDLTIAADATSRLEVTFTLIVPMDTGVIDTIDFQTIIDIAEAT